MSVPKIKLKALNMSKSKENNHPQINDDSQYLCLIGEEFYAGTFSQEWFGWTFKPQWGHNCIQFDAPGYNSSKWVQIWEIRIVD